MLINYFEELENPEILCKVLIGTLNNIKNTLATPSEPEEVVKDSTGDDVDVDNLDGNDIELIFGSHSGIPTEFNHGSYTQ